MDIGRGLGVSKGIKSLDGLFLTTKASIDKTIIAPMDS